MPDKFAILPTLSEATEQRPYRAGIFTYRQLPSASPDTLVALLPKSLRAGQVNVNDWIAAAEKKMAE